VTNDAAQRTAYHAYLPFGLETTTNATATGPMKFTGHERDANGVGAADDLDYMHARFCSPVTGRFLSVDPKPRRSALRMPQVWNRYAYAAGNPLKFVDPDGLDIRIAADGNRAAVEKMLTRVITKPSGKMQLEKLATDRNFTVTFRDERINSSKAIQSFKQREPGSKLTAGRTGETTVKMDGQTHRGASVALDVAAITEAHKDPSGVTTTAHEIYHAVGVQQGLTIEQLEAQDQPTNETGPAGRFGDSVASEQATISEEEAYQILVEWLTRKPEEPR
jgi:RHS repeat-associated protein